jgi:hypothetical protein
MVDRAYWRALPAFRADLEELRSRFSEIPSRTDWVRLRVDPLLSHVVSLERVLKSKRFAAEASRLRHGMPMFHADLVYLRQNILELKRTLQREKKAAARSS